MKNKNFITLSLLIFSFLCPTLLSAKHIIGGTFSYEFLQDLGNGKKRFRFTMKVYRDCNGGGADFDQPAQFAIYKGSWTDNGRYDQFAINYSKYTKLIPDTPQCVQNVPNVCVEEAVYIFERDLVYSPTDSYWVVYQRCCRNETIRNLITPGDVGATFMVELTPKAMELNNSSPVFNNFPPIIICNNVPLNFDHSATDPDGDQMIYKFCSPLQGGGNILQAPAVYSCEGAVPTPPCEPPYENVYFTTPTYTPTNPMGGSPQVQINPITGKITGTPNKLGQYVVAVCVQEFRNGVLLSTVQREFQFNVVDCTPNVLAAIDTAVRQGANLFVINSCGSKTLTLKNNSLKKSNVKKFLWIFDMGNGVTVKDSTSWSNITLTFPDTGQYHGYLYLNRQEGECKDSAEITINIFPAIHADFSFAYDTCVAGPVQFKDLSTGDGVIIKWKWNFGVPGGGSSETDPSYRYPIPGNHPVTLTVTDRNHCSDSEVKIINWFPAPPIIVVKPSSYLGCIPGEITFNNLSSPIDGTYNIVWDFGDGDTAVNVISPTHIYDVQGVYDVGVSITSPIGCHIDTVFQKLIRVEPRPVAAFSCDPETGLTNLNSTVHFIDESIDANRWNWTFGPFGNSNLENPTFTFPDTGLIPVRLIVTHPRGCQDSITKYLDIIPEIRWYMPNAFTPNGDARNEGFMGKGFMYGARDFSMTIWNRWGELVFETTDPNEAWNGRRMNTGGMSPSGVYVYLVRFTGPRGEPYEFKGYATLVR